MKNSTEQRFSAAYSEADLLAHVKAGTLAQILPGSEFSISRTVKNETPNNEWRPISPDTSNMLPPNYYRPYLPTAEIIEFNSGGTVDAPGQAGCRTMDVFMADFSDEWKHEEITMNGTSWVDSQETHNGVVQMVCTSWGTLRRNEDSITGRGKTSTNAQFGRIGTEHNISELPWIWVPEGWVLEIMPTNYRSEGLNARFTINTYDVGQNAEFLIEDVDPVGPTNPAKGEFIRVLGGNFVWFAALNISGATVTQSAGITAFLRKN